MEHSFPLPSLEAIKNQAKRLHSELKNQFPPVGYNQCLELLAHQHGYRNWNVFHAAIGNRAPVSPIHVGAHIAGRYLNQPFMAEVIGIKTLSEGRTHITLELEQAVDVVTFDSFSNFRKRVNAVISHKGESLEKTSNGHPQLILSL